MALPACMHVLQFLYILKAADGHAMPGRFRLSVGPTPTAVCARDLTDNASVSLETKCGACAYKPPNYKTFYIISVRTLAKHVTMLAWNATP